MNKYSRQTVFCPQKAALYNLCPYASVREGPDGIGFAGQGRSGEIVIADPAAGKALAERLAAGLPERELLALLDGVPGADAEEWLAALLQEGIIE